MIAGVIEQVEQTILRLNLAIAGVTSLFVGIFLAFFLEYLRNLPRRARAA